ncbi:unnamed protein product [Acanthoscelides obtectus]|uniref:Uncharacterized protein n=1 Tax=Acanthoscelides obtectus TaxID=200917 RepID=A0A9P0P427_ACAOB|nr:unnamed protein product [Acanthoscelides obtectus]CAK1649409.1 hypothetical protein AOBTE_LOCUS16219 [Acanthoscelides obtectus]
MPLTRDQMADVRLIIKQTIEELLSDDKFLTLISDKIEQKLGIKESQQKMVELEKQIVDLRHAKNKLECDLGKFQQHARRKSFRIVGMKESHGISVLEQVLTLCEDNLKTRVLEENIENCFWLGRKKNEQRSVLFTVNSHNLKMKLLRNRKLLKGSGITLTEDMSPARYKLYQKAVQKWGKQKTWFYNGEIWVKLRDNKLQIKTEEDLNNMAQ